MSENRHDLDEPPLYFSCDPLARQFPPAWRDIRFRRSALNTAEGELVYYCPICKGAFDHTDIDYLQGDHIWPYSLFGDSSWANYQLICGSCNARKRAFIDDSVRRVLGDGSFRQFVCDYLRKAADDRLINRTEIVALLLIRDSADRVGS